MKTGAVIVAAGVSTGMVNANQLKQGGVLSMLERIILNFQRAGIKEIVVVTGHESKLIQKRLQRYAITFLRNEDYEKTQMFDSVKIGLRFFQDKCEAVFICPADIPFFTEDTVKKLLKEKGEMILPMCDGKVGHPIRIAGSLIPQILSYDGAYGLEGALKTLPVESVKISIEDEGAITEADAREAYQHLEMIHDAELMRPHVSVYLAGKRPFFSQMTKRLLKLIDALGSVKEACYKCGISYSKGWTLIETAEEELGYKIVERQQGGKNGGVAHVTEKGRRWVALFERYEQQVEKAAGEIYEQIFLDSELF
ncbi:MAG: NTP transferase domain-containing protein [Brotaphodocola sp.]